MNVNTIWLLIGKRLASSSSTVCKDDTIWDRKPMHRLKK